MSVCDADNVRHVSAATILWFCRMERKDVVKKPTTWRKAPVVKQTRTSMYRVIKTNPLLLKKNECNNFGLKGIELPQNLTLPSTITMGYPKILHDYPAFSEPQRNTPHTTASDVPNVLRRPGANDKAKTRNVGAPPHFPRKTEATKQNGVQFQRPRDVKQEKGNRNGDGGRQSLAVLKKQTSAKSIITTARIRRSISDDRWVRFVVHLCCTNFNFTWW